MLYKDYVERKTANAIRIKSTEGYPCVFDNSKGRPLKDYKLYGNSIQDGTPTPESPVEVESVGDLTKNLFDMNKLIEQGWVQQVDGSYYVKKSSTPYQQVLWENAENYTGQLKILFKVKYSLDNKPGCYLWVNYTDGTHLMVAYQDGKIVADTWYSPTISRTITHTNKTVKNVTWMYGTTISSTWVKDIIITKDIAVTEYEPYGYKIPIICSSKNLINEKGITLSSGYWSDVDGHMIGNNSRFIGISPIKCNPNEKYTLSSNLEIYTIWFFNNDTPISKIYRVNKVIAFTTPENCNRLRISLANTSENTDTVAFQWIQLELGSTVTEYEPYIAPVTTNIYLDEPLRKFEDYVDYIDFKAQKVVRNIIKYSLGAEGIYRKLNNVIRFNDTANMTYGKPDYHMRSTIFRNYNGFALDQETVFHHPTSPYAYYWSVYWHRLGLTYDGTNVYRTDDTEQTPLTGSEIINITKKWLNTLSDKDREVYIILNTPTEKSITLPALKTFKGTNIISVDTNISPSNIQVQYIER